MPRLFRTIPREMAFGMLSRLLCPHRHLCMNGGLVGMEVLCVCVHAHVCGCCPSATCTDLVISSCGSISVLYRHICGFRICDDGTYEHNSHII